MHDFVKVQGELARARESVNDAITRQFPVGSTVLWQSGGRFKFGTVTLCPAGRGLVTALSESGDHILDASLIVIPEPGDLVMYRHGQNERRGVLVEYSQIDREFTVQCGEHPQPHRIAIEKVLQVCRP